MKFAWVTSQSRMHANSRFTSEEVMCRRLDSQLTMAHDSETGCKVVIKQAVQAQSQVFTEIEFLRSISHPYVIKPIYYDMHEGILVLPFAYGEDLLSVLSKEEVIDEDAMRKTAYCLLQCLEYIHSLGIVHNDIKPDNILVCDADYTGDNVILSDFGLAEECDENGLCHGFGGTFQYFPPEKINGYSYNEKADIWSLGVTILTCLLGPLTLRTQKYKQITSVMVSQSSKLQIWMSFQVMRGGFF